MSNEPSAEAVAKNIMVWIRGGYYEANPAKLETKIETIVEVYGNAMSGEGDKETVDILYDALDRADNKIQEIVGAVGEAGNSDEEKLERIRELASDYVMEQMSVMTELLGDD